MLAELANFHLAAPDFCRPARAQRPNSIMNFDPPDLTLGPPVGVDGKTIDLSERRAPIRSSGAEGELLICVPPTRRSLALLVAAAAAAAAAAWRARIAPPNSRRLSISLTRHCNQSCGRPLRCDSARPAARLVKFQLGAPAARRPTQLGRHSEVGARPSAAPLAPEGQQRGRLSGRSLARSLARWKAQFPPHCAS